MPLVCLPALLPHQLPRRPHRRHHHPCHQLPLPRLLHPRYHCQHPEGQSCIMFQRLDSK